MNGQIVGREFVLPPLAANVGGPRQVRFSAGFVLVFGEILVIHVPKVDPMALVV